MVRLICFLKLIGLKKYVSRFGRTCKTNMYWLNLWSDVTRDIDANKLILFDVPKDKHVYIGVGYNEYYESVYAITNWDDVLMKLVPLSDIHVMYSIDIY